MTAAVTTSTNRVLRRRGRRAAVLVAAWMLGTVACGQDGAPQVEVPGTTVGGEGGTGILLELLDRLVVVDEAPREGYSRDLFDHWTDVDGSGCRTRSDVLAAQALGLVQRDVARYCVIVAGDWYSVVDGVLHSGDPAEIDVDHVVALAEAWDSGASEWTYAQRQRFANDPVNLLVMTRQTNRDKGDLDAGEWRPPRRDSWCVVAGIVALTKVKYALTVDPAEREGLIAMAASCDAGGQVSVPGVPLAGTPEFEQLALQIVS